MDGSSDRGSIPLSSIFYGKGKPRLACRGFFFGMKRFDFGPVMRYNYKKVVS